MAGSALQLPIGGAGIVGGYAPLDSGLLVPNAYLDADLAAIAALTTTTYGRSLLALANQAALVAEVGVASFYGARAIRTTTQSILDNTITAISYNSETAPGWDVGAVHDNSTNPTRFTVPTGGAGKWAGSGGGAWDANGSGVFRLMWWRLNGTTDVPGSGSMPPPIGASPRHAQAVLPAILLADGDYLEFVVYQDSGGTRTFGAASLGLDSASASFYRVG